MRVGFIGGGNLAGALAAGALRAGVIGAGDVTMSEPDDDRRAALRVLGVRAVWDNAEVARQSDLLILAVKPQQMNEALASVAAHLSPQRTLVVSIAAGVRIHQLETSLPRGARVVRVMPNTPLLIGSGMSVLCGGTHASKSDLARAESLFAAGGRTLILDESHFDAVTAVSGTGPAYFYYLVEALRDAGLKLGLPAEAAELLALQTFVGAAHLLEQTSETPDALRRMVTSPGGTTAAAIAKLQDGQFAELLSSAVGAAARRSQELADGAKGQHRDQAERVLAASLSWEARRRTEDESAA